MVNYSKYRKRPDVMDFFFYQVFQLEVERYEDENISPLSIRSLREYNTHGIPLECESFTIELPDIIINHLLESTISDSSQRKFYLSKKVLNCSMMDYIPGDCTKINNFLKTRDNYEIIKPLTNRYLHEPERFDIRKKLIDPTGKFVFVLSAFIILNELVNTQKNNTFSIPINNKLLKSIQKNKGIEKAVSNYTGAFNRKYNPVAKELLRQYHELDFPLYTHSDKLISLLTKIEFPKSLHIPYFKLKNKEGKTIRVELSQKTRISNVISAIEEQ